MLMEIDQSAHY